MRSSTSRACHWSRGGSRPAPEAVRCLESAPEPLLPSRPSLCSPGSPPSLHPSGKSSVPDLFIQAYSLALLLALLLRLLFSLHLARSPPAPRVLSLWGRAHKGRGSPVPHARSRPPVSSPPACADSSRLGPEGLLLAGPTGAPASPGLHVGLRLQPWGCLVGSLVFWLRPLAHLQSVNMGMVSPVSQITEGSACSGEWSSRWWKPSSVIAVSDLSPA